jgi:hypothetical protein
MKVQLSGSLWLVTILISCMDSILAGGLYRLATSNDRQTSLTDNPRHNASLYDIVLNRNSNYGELIGYVSDVLKRKGLLNQNIKVNKYKLIYFSPQVIYADESGLNNSGRAFFSSSLAEPLFSVNSLNGSIHIYAPTNEPTLEYLCVKKTICSCQSCIFTLNVIYSIEYNRIKTETVRVFIDDFNDYSPEFYSNSAEFVLNISEASRIGDQFRLSNARAYDLDAYYNKVSYYISERDIINQHDNVESRSAIFDVLGPQMSDVKSRELTLVLRTHVDFEVKRKYVLYLIASDNGKIGTPNGVLKNSKRLIVNIIDENDNSPVCEKSLFIESVRENRIERDFLQIRASDLDAGANAKLTFSIESGGLAKSQRRRVKGDKRMEENEVKAENEDDGALFEINKDTGWLSLRRTLDYEKKSFYELIIKVI